MVPIFRRKNGIVDFEAYVPEVIFFYKILGPNLNENITYLTTKLIYMFSLAYLAELAD